MEKIIMWCKALILVSVMSGVLKLLMPDGKIKKCFNSFITLMFVFVLVFPLSDIDRLAFSVKTAGTEYGDYKQEFEKYGTTALILSAQSEGEKYIKSLFTELKIDGECNVICNMYKNEIIFSEIRLDGDFGSDIKSKLYKSICEFTDRNTLVIFNGEIYE